jgi:hypothetical protein
MVFKDNQTLTGLYAGITKKVEPSQDQLVRQAPVLSNTEMSKDQSSLAEAYKAMTHKGMKEMHCEHASKGCDCSGCKECEANQEPIEEAKKKAKPDYMDVDKDGNKKESMKKALKDKSKTKSLKKEGLSFKDLYNVVMTESKQEVVCGTKINPSFQYNCVMKDGTKKVLKGESVLGLKDKLESVSKAS